jgi:membrane-associated phospholipid phosphatase
VSVPARGQPSPVRWPPIVWLLLEIEFAAVVATAPFYSRFGLSVDLTTAAPQLTFVGMAALAAFLTRNDRDGIGQTFAALVLLLTSSGIIGPAQYLAAALSRPLIDPHLAMADAWLGVSVPALTQWTAQYDWLRALLTWSYRSLLFQFPLPILVLGVVSRNLERLWEYLFHFHVCAIVTLIGLAGWPAACVFSYTGTASLLNQDRFIRHLEALRAGTFEVIRFDDIEGLVSFPSFHVAGGWMVTWACRGHPKVLAVLIPLNIAMSASTVLLGAHYFVDLLGTAAMCVGSVLLYRALKFTYFGQRRPATVHPPRLAL